MAGKPHDGRERALTATERQQRWRAKLKKTKKAKRRIQSRNAYAKDNGDAYFTCPEAVISLLHLERSYLPPALWEPAAGNGAISNLLLRAGHSVGLSDIRDYGLPNCLTADYFTLEMPPEIEGVVTNPPYRLARRFLEKALADGARYVALLVRTNFLFEGSGRAELLDERHAPTRIWTAAPRLPMMHRADWTGKRAPSNTPHSWSIWDTRANHREYPRRFNWREICALPEWQGWLPEPSPKRTKGAAPG